MCKEKLSVAEPKLLEAMAALKTLTPKDFTELAAYKSLTKNIQIALAGVCIMLGKKPNRKNKDDYLESSK